MRKLLSLAATAAAVCTASVADATTFAGGFNVTSSQGDGLIVDASPSSGAVSFDLTAPGGEKLNR